MQPSMRQGPKNPLDAKPANLSTQLKVQLGAKEAARNQPGMTQKHFFKLCLVAESEQLVGRECSCFE